MKKLSREEARERRILVNKDSLKLFSQVKRAFHLKVMDRLFKTRIYAERCTCVGPDKPHEHFYLDARSFQDVLAWKTGEVITVGMEQDGSYSLILKH